MQKNSDGTSISYIWIYVKDEYKNTDGTINKEQAEEDRIAFQKRLDNGEWPEILKERIWETAEKVELSSMYNGFVVDCQDLQMSSDLEKVVKYTESLKLYPNFYWIGFVESFGSDIIIYVGDDYINSDGKIDVEKAVMNYIETETDIQSLMMQIDDNMQEVEKVLAVHEWIVRECEYDYENYLNGTIPTDSYYAEGVIKNNLAVCNGYALAMNYLLEKLGIECHKVDSASMNHAWNIVNIDGNYYHIDSTWNDWGKDDNNEGIFYHRYFIKSDNEFLDLEHNGWSSTIVCDEDNSYAGYIFREYETERRGFSYYDGFWYFVSNNTKIMKGKIDGTKLMLCKDYQEYIVGAFIYKNNYYIATATKVYKIDMTTGIETEVFNVADSTIGTSIKEFVIKNDIMKIDGESTSAEISLIDENAKITIDKERITLEENKEEKLVVNVTNGNIEDVVWVSANPDVAKVDSKGNIVAIKKGNTIIYASINGTIVACDVVVTEARKLNGLVKVDGVWGYYADGVIDTSYTGLVDYNGAKWYVVNGVLSFRNTGLYKISGSYYYIEGGKWNENFTGLGDCNGATWYVLNGKISFRTSGQVVVNGVTYTVSGGKVTGAAGLQKIDGKYYYVVNGEVDTTYTGLAEYNGAKWYVVKGVLSFRNTGLYKINGSYYYIEGGKWNESYTGLGKCNGATWYVADGKISFRTTGTVVVDGVTYTVSGGKVVE